MAHPSTHDPREDQPGKTAEIVVFGLLLGGIGLLILGLWATLNLVNLRFFGLDTEGYVIQQDIRQEEVERYEDGVEFKEEIESYYAVVSFTTSTGTHTITSWDSGTNAPLYPTNSKVTVVYPRGQPEGGRIQNEISGFRGIFGPLMLFTFGGALIGTSRMIRKFR